MFMVVGWSPLTELTCPLQVALRLGTFWSTVEDFLK